MAKRNDFIKLHKEFCATWIGYFVRFMVCKHRTKLMNRGIKIYIASLHNGPKTRGFKDLEVENMLAEKVIELENTAWAAHIVIAPRENGTVRFDVLIKKS